jgi:hypothetical protein
MKTYLFDAEIPEEGGCDQEFSQKLREIISSSKKVTIARSPKNWPSHFRLLRTRDGVSQKRIKRALKWYEENINNKFCPFCASAKSFRAKFLNIENAMGRDNSVPDPQNKVSVTPQAKNIVEFTGDLIYPSAEDKKDELQFIQVSLDNFTDFLTRMNSLREPLKEEAIEKDIAKFGKDSRTSYMGHWKDSQMVEHFWLVFNLGSSGGIYFASASGFVTDWLRETHRFLWRWHEAGKSSRLMRHVWHMESKRFQKMLYHVFLQYYQDNGNASERKEHFMELIKNAD